MGASAEGAEMTTFFAPPWMWAFAFSMVVNTPVICTGNVSRCTGSNVLYTDIYLPYELSLYVTLKLVTLRVLQFCEDLHSSWYIHKNYAAISNHANYYQTHFCFVCFNNHHHLSRKLSLKQGSYTWDHVKYQDIPDQFLTIPGLQNKNWYWITIKSKEFTNLRNKKSNFLSLMNSSFLFHQA